MTFINLFGRKPGVIEATQYFKPDGQTIDSVSQAIASYLIEHGRHSCFPEDFDPRTSAGKNSIVQHYRIDKVLGDGRKLSAYFGNVNNRPVTNPMRNCILEFYLTPVREDQFGYTTSEHGLTGKFDLFQILFGLPNIEGFTDLIGISRCPFSTIPVSEYEKCHIEDIQRKYNEFRTRAFEQIRGGESK